MQRHRRIRIIVTLPTSQKGPFPGVVCIGGHGSDQYSPYDEHTVAKDSAKAQSDHIYKGFGTALAKRGYVTVSTTVSQHKVYEEGRLLMIDLPGLLYFFEKNLYGNRWTEPEDIQM